MAKKNAKRKNEKYFSQSEETVSPNNLTKWKKGETFLGGIEKQGVSKKRFFSNFSFFGDNI